MWLLLAEKKIFNLRYFNILSANFFFDKNFCKIFEDITKFGENFQWNFASLQHSTFPCCLNAFCPEKRRKMPNFGNFLAGSISVSAFLNIGRVLQYKYKYRIRSQDPNNFSDTETRWLVCALANFFSRIAIVFQRAVDQNALLLQVVPIKKGLKLLTDSKLLDFRIWNLIVHFFSGSDNCKFGDWSVWGVCNKGSQQRTREVVQTMRWLLFSIILYHYFHNYHYYYDHYYNYYYYYYCYHEYYHDLQITRGSDRPKCQKKAILTRSCKWFVIPANQSF